MNTRPYIWGMDLLDALRYFQFFMFNRSCYDRDFLKTTHHTLLDLTGPLPPYGVYRYYILPKCLSGRKGMVYYCTGTRAFTHKKFGNQTHGAVLIHSS